MWARFSRSSTYVTQGRIQERSRSSVDLLHPQIYNTWDHSRLGDVGRAPEPSNDDLDDNKDAELAADDETTKKIYEDEKSNLNGSMLEIALKILQYVYAVALVVGLFCYWFFVLKSMLNVATTSTGPVSPKMHVAIPQDTRVPVYLYHPIPVEAEEITVNLELEGPFIPYLDQSRDYSEDTMKGAAKKYVLECILERWTFHSARNPNVHVTSLTRPNSAADVEDNSAFPAARQKIVMTNDTGTTHHYPLDYNNYPRTARLVIGKMKQKPPGRHHFYYAIGFGVDSVQTRAVPFSLIYSTDPITMRFKVLIGMLPLALMAVLMLCGVNRCVAALFGACTSAANIAKTGAKTTNRDLIRWWDSDLIVYIFSVSLLVSLLVETRVYSWLAYKFAWLVRLSFWCAVLLVNFLAGLLSIWLNNIFIAALLLPLTVRLMEMVHVQPWPVILNLAFMCNVSGRAFVGTLVTKTIFNHEKAATNNLDYKKLFGLTCRGAVIVAIETAILFAIIYATLAPQYAGKVYQITENVQLMHLWYRASLAIPNVSLRHHKIKRRITIIREHLYQEMTWMKLKKPPYDVPSEKKSTIERLAEIKLRSDIHNGFLLFKCFIIIGCFVGFMVPYIYNLKLSSIWWSEEIRLGYISMYIVILCLLFVHSRDFEVILKRIDFQSIFIILCLAFMTSIFVVLTEDVADYIWKTYGMTMSGTREQKIHLVVFYLMSFTTVAGVFNEHVVCLVMLNTIFQYSGTEGLDAFKEVFAGFLYTTGDWGSAGPMGTIVNIVVLGMAAQLGHRITTFRWLSYGIPLAFLNIVMVYFYLLIRYLS